MFFFFSHDGEFVLKTLRADEVKKCRERHLSTRTFILDLCTSTRNDAIDHMCIPRACPACIQFVELLAELLPSFAAHVEEHATRTMLPRFVGAYAMKGVPGLVFPAGHGHAASHSSHIRHRSEPDTSEVMWLTAMCNVFATPQKLVKKYDLKGSTLGRWGVPLREAVLKDANFSRGRLATRALPRAAHRAPTHRKLRLGGTRRTEFVAQVILARMRMGCQLVVPPCRQIVSRLWASVLALWHLMTLWLLAADLFVLLCEVHDACETDYNANIL